MVNSVQKKRRKEGTEKRRKLEGRNGEQKEERRTNLVIIYEKIWSLHIKCFKMSDIFRGKHFRTAVPPPPFKVSGSTHDQTFPNFSTRRKLFAHCLSVIKFQRRNSEFFGTAVAYFVE